MSKQLQRGLIVLCALFFCGHTVMAKSKEQSLDRIVVVVNDIIITQSEIDKASLAIKGQIMGANAPLPSANELQKQVLEQMINRKLQLQAAEQAGIHVKDDQVDSIISNIANGNHVSVAELYQKVAAQGLSKTDYRKEISEEIALHQIEQQEVGSKIIMTPDEVKSFMHSKSWQAATPSAPKEYYIEDVIVLLSESAGAADIAAAKKQADDLFNKMHQGTTYHDIATAEANNKSVETSDLGWRKLTEIPSAFANSIQSMKKGSVIAPIQTANGFHIIHLADMREPANTNNAAAPTEEEAKQMVYQKKLETAVKKWVAKLRNQAVINMHP